MSQQRAKQLTIFSLIMMTVVSVDSVRNLPSAAIFGSQIIGFYLIGAVLFLFPSALISAELAATWPKSNGIYSWVKMAMGQRWALLAIWLQWIENVIWYPALLFFVAGTLGYLIHPSLPEQKSFLVCVILGSFWGITWLNLRGIQASANFSTFCSITGLLLPMILIIALGATWLIQGLPSEITLSTSNIWPSLDQPLAWVSLTSIMLSLCGMEIATVHAADVANPQKAFPIALLCSAVIILSTLIMGSLALAVVIPAENIGLITGIMQACDVFLQTFHLQWLLPIIGVGLVIGGLGSISNWMIAPTKGLLIAGQDGLLPPHLQTTNHAGAPKALLIYQAIIVSILTSAFLFMPSVNGSYWLLGTLAVQLYMIMYVLMYIAAIVLRYRYPDIERPFQIPGGMLGLSLVAFLGVAGSILTWTVSFLPPPHINVGSLASYQITLVAGLMIMGLPPFIAYHFRSPHWVKSLE